MAEAIFHSRFDFQLNIILHIIIVEGRYITIVLRIDKYNIMSASDNEFEQYLNELNDILIETFPTDCLDNLYLPGSIHEVVWLPCIYGWRSSLVLSPFPISTETIPSPSPYITFICPLLIPSSFLNSHVCNCSLNVLRLAIPLWSAHVCLFIFWRTLSPVP